MWCTLFGVIAILFGIEDAKGDPIFALVGPNPMRQKENEMFSIAASYKYCSNSYPCPSCPRRVYVNVFNRSKCLGTVQASQLDCMYHNCKRRQFRAPARAGTYEIRMFESLRVNGSRCMYKDASGQGIIIGTVIVGTPPPDPDVLVTNIGFFSATIQWIKSSKNVFYTVLINDNKGDTRRLAEKTTKSRVIARNLTPGADYNVSVKASNPAGDSGWIHYTFTTKQAFLTLNLAPKNKTVVEGQPFTLRCFITGRPRPSITWFKDGKLIGHRQNGRVLNVPRASTDDEGEYVCTASNRMPGRNISARANVVVFVPPVIGHLYSLVSDETIPGRLGQTIVLLCGLNKDNHVNYAWFKDGSPLSNLTSNSTHELKISLSRRDDFGIYECEAFNKAGKTRKRIKVFADEEQKSSSSASSRSGEAAHYYYIVGVLACMSLLLLVIIIALRQYYRRKLSAEYTEERPYLTPRDDLPQRSPQTVRQTDTEPRKVTETREISRTVLSMDSRPLPPIPTERSKVDADNKRYADLESIEKRVYQELEREELETKDLCADMENAFENAVKLETEDKSYLEVVP